MQVRERISGIENELTTAERRLSTALLLDYPFAGLDTIQALAEKTQTSPPTISRFVSKLGFGGYQDFQRHLIEELKEGKRSPLDLHRSDRPLMGNVLEDFVTRAGRVVSETAESVTAAQFERLTEMLADPKRAIYVIGGRISDALALYLSRHMRQMRAKVYHLPADPEIWPEYLLRMKSRDVLFIVDFRRYQPNLCHLARRASEGPAPRILLMTDKWLSPVSKYASEVIATPIDSGTVWDSYSGALVLMEAMVTKIAEDTWDNTSRRIEAWDAMRLDSDDTDMDE
ncbi:MurR/RpiR family transcriptional regulator [Paracoccus seriniphilus]|uniref:Transcriptional regulator, RpiR family n=1 Tax=Paracoccus seriniphilus TaxID=184748 RepID=A0A239Q3G6_9RHOB|nr:MurR/RpiR family transcriptional regulator [Paracoccus seriniphilus]WCR15580.1 MurR/RpiR family transcriptional regulator [Paracoccus seriniphilus]SNT76742.1 transcriptional regulator, RpiR family [Paracoccus seriniphilus]